MRAEIRKANPELDFSGMSAKLGQVWKTLKPEEKLPYEKQKEADKLRFAAAVKEFEAKGGVMNSAADSDDEDAPKRKKKQKKDPNAPKRPATAYFLFAADQRTKDAAEGKKLGFEERGKAHGQRWAAVSAEEKKTYTDKAKVLKDKYDAENPKKTPAEKKSEKKQKADKKKKKDASDDDDEESSKKKDKKKKSKKDKKASSDSDDDESVAKKKKAAAAKKKAKESKESKDSDDDEAAKKKAKKASKKSAKKSKKADSDDDDDKGKASDSD